MRATILSLLITLLCCVGCSSVRNNAVPGMLKARDFNYKNVSGFQHEAARTVMRLNPTWYKSVVAVQCSGPDSEGYASGVCIGVEDGYSWIATAHHVIKSGSRYVRHTWIGPDGKTHYQVLDIVDTYNHATRFWNGRDFSLLKVKGELPHFVEPAKLPPFPSYSLRLKTFDGGFVLEEFDITVGYEGWGVDNKTVYEGRAEKGQSGGGVFHSTVGLIGVVSTHTQGVTIWPCLVDMRMTHVVGRN